MAPDETKLFAAVKEGIALANQWDANYAAWARKNYRRILAVFFAGDK